MMNKPDFHSNFEEIRMLFGIKDCNYLHLFNEFNQQINDWDNATVIEYIHFLSKKQIREYSNNTWSNDYKIVSDFVKKLDTIYNKIIAADKPPEVDNTNLIIDQNQLSIIHGKYDDKLWDKIKINDFYTNFQTVSTKTLKIKNKPAFAYLLHYVYKNHKLTELPKNFNINQWADDNFKILNLSKYKEYPTFERAGKNKPFYEIIGKLI